VSKLRDPSAAQLVLIPVEVSGSEFDPRASEGLLIVEGVSGELRGSEFGELDAEPTSVAERDKEYRISKPKVSFAYLATQHIAEQRRERFACLRLHEQMDARAKFDDPGFSCRGGHGPPL